MSDKKRCCYCGKEKDLRPYGPGGAWLCGKCAFAPERAAESERRMRAAMDEAFAGGGDVLLTDCGPIPMKRGQA